MSVRTTYAEVASITRWYAGQNGHFAKTAVHFRDARSNARSAISALQIAVDFGGNRFDVRGVHVAIDVARAEVIPRDVAQLIQRDVDCRIQDDDRFNNNTPEWRIWA